MTGFDRFLVVRSGGVEDAAVRLQSEPLLRGLRGLPGPQAVLLDPRTAGAIGAGGRACILFHFADAPAIAFVRRHAPPGALVVCLGSDIYRFDRYLAVHDLAHLYVMPSPAHARVLAAQVARPVFALPECLDPMARPPEGWGTADSWFPPRPSRRLLWFGYAESFGKGMASLLPVIRARVADGTLDGFGLITDAARPGPAPGVSVLPFSVAGFRAQASRFDYAVLSHLPLDLHVNSLVKSANKAATALAAGLIPLASDTPNYRALMERCGLERFLYDSPRTLDALLRRLDPAADSARVRASRALAVLRDDLSEAALLDGFLGILRAYADRDAGPWDESAAPPGLPAPGASPPVGFRTHLADLLPSALRAVRSRLR